MSAESFSPGASGAGPQRPIVLGTRGSDLARAQSAMVEQALRSHWPDLEIALEIITTRGDENSRHASEPVDRKAGRKGLFTSEIERALQDRRIDVAVHSAKDLPSDAADGLQVVAALPRAAVEDVLITKSSGDLSSLSSAATIATGSVRRQHQLRRLRPDLQIVDLRGNVPTRLRKLKASSWAGIILARAGIERLGFDLSCNELHFEEQTFSAATLSVVEFLPAGGQGIVALQIRADDEAARAFLFPLNDGETLLCLRGEREFLRLLQGDCGTPVGVLAQVHDGLIRISAQLFDATGAEPRVAALQQTRIDQTPEALAAELLELING